MSQGTAMIQALNQYALSGNYARDIWIGYRRRSPLGLHLSAIQWLGLANYDPDLPVRYYVDSTGNVLEVNTLTRVYTLIGKLDEEVIKIYKSSYQVV